MSPAWRNRLRPRLRTVLIAVNLLVLGLPLASISVLQLYESELIRRTEAELIGQGALVAEVYADAVRQQLVTLPSEATATFGSVASPRYWSPRKAKHPISPRPPRLNRSTTTIYPDNPTAIRKKGRASTIAKAAGHRMGGLLKRATRTTLSGMRVVGPNGYVVATSRGGFGGYIGSWPEVRRGMKGEPTSFLRHRKTGHTDPSLRSVSRGTPVRVFVGYPVVVNGRVWGVVVLSRTPLDVAKALYVNRRDLLGGAIALLLIAAMVAFLTSRFLARPLRDLKDQAARVAEGQRGTVPRIPHAGTREVAELSAAISQMAEALQGRATYLEAFSRNVSHAFKTPLTAIRGTVELLQDHLDEMDSEQKARFLGNLEAEAARLDRLVKRLMVLARADVLEPGREKVRVQEVFSTLRQRHGEHCTLKLRLDPAELAVAVAPETLDAILDNLVGNAVRHGDGDVGVVGSAAANGLVQLVVTDNGPGIDVEVRSRMFEPFVTTAGSQGGTGLGLSIVRALTRAHGGDVVVAPSDEQDRGARLVVTLPAALTTER
ncbi:MAG: HAMP domain-containing histidine kinase [Myxococcales bacterium]|nr:HAMP domain-containing histidine kinase [Myxococcales bacterium]